MVHLPLTVRQTQVVLWTTVGLIWVAWCIYSVINYVNQVPNMRMTVDLNSPVTLPTFFLSMYTRGPYATVPNHTLCLFDDKPNTDMGCLNPSGNGFAVNGPFVMDDGSGNIGWGIILQPNGPLPESNNPLPGTFSQGGRTWAIGLRAQDADVHSMTMQIYGSRYTNPRLKETFFNFLNPDHKALYEKIGATTINGRGYLRLDAGLNATGVQGFLSQHLFEEWAGIRHPYSNKPVETYYSVGTTTYLGSDDTDLVWAMGRNGTQGLLQQKEIMAAMFSFAVDKNTEVPSRTLIDLGASVFAPASIFFSVIVFMMGSGRYQPIGLVQKSLMKPVGWTRRIYDLRPAARNDVDGRLRQVEEFMSLLQDHYIDVHASLLGNNNVGGAVLTHQEMSTNRKVDLEVGTVYEAEKSQ